MEEPGEACSSRCAKLQTILRKANTADFFQDHMQDASGALKTYLEACSLLQHMICNTAEDEYRWMLEAIWSSYMSRIAELRQSAWKSEENTIAEVEDFGLETAVEYGINQQLQSGRVSIAIAETAHASYVSPILKEISRTRSSHISYASSATIPSIWGSPGYDHDREQSPGDDQGVDGTASFSAEELLKFDLDESERHTGVVERESRDFKMQEKPYGYSTSRGSQLFDANKQSVLDPVTLISTDKAQDTVPELRNQQIVRASFASTLISDDASRCSTIDSYRTAIASRATSTTLSFISAVSVLSFERLGSSRSRIGHRFRDLLQRPHGIVPGHDFDTRQLNSLKAESTNQVASAFNEHDWCGRGMHVDFMDDESVPLESLDFAGRGVTACVDIVRCRRVRLARKIVKLPPSRRVTEQLLQEVRTLHQVSHAHIVRLVGTYILKRNFAALLYPAAETNLEDYMQEAQEARPTIPRDPVRAFEIRDVLSKGSLCLSSGLRFLHRHGINHSDIKPANIVLKKGPLFFDKSYKMYFCDFGISRILDPNGESQTEEDRGKTPRYAAPEVMRTGEPHGRAADIYSFGYVLAEMLTVSSGKSIEEFRNYVQDHDNPNPSISAPFKAYHKLHRPGRIEEFLAMCYRTGGGGSVPHNIISAMVNEDPGRRPRLLYNDKYPNALIFDMDCEHNNDGPPMFQVG